MIKIIPLKYYNHHKFIIFEFQEWGHKILYTYKVFLQLSKTELSEYSNNAMVATAILPFVLEFDELNPMKSIKRFKQLLLLK